MENTNDGSRVVLFRGKPLFNNYFFVHGSLIISPFQHYIRVYRETYKHEEYVVEHKTIGQFTGFTDMKGFSIYVGDIVEFVSEKDPNVKCKAEICMANGCWSMKIMEAYDGYEAGDIAIILKRRNSGTIIDDVEVIGNIHGIPKKSTT